MAGNQGLAGTGHALIRAGARLLPVLLVPEILLRQASANATVVAMVAGGMTTREILAEHSELTPADIHESLLYAAEALQEREPPLRLTA